MSVEHPFAKFVRVLGKGKNGSRSLTLDEARESMEMILNNKVEPEQLGAFLMLLRLKEETPEELAGFASAVRSHSPPPEDLKVDIDWSTYAGKKRQLPWFLLAAFVLSENGFRIFMHGAKGHTAGRVYVEDALKLFKVNVVNSWQDVSVQLDKCNFSYMPIEGISPVLARIINLRNILGLRSPVHTLCRLLNPLMANLTVDGVFHPPYAPIHQKTSLMLGTTNSITIRGDGGEAECKPDSDTEIHWIEQGELSISIWPRLIKRRLVKPDHLVLEHLKAVWKGEESDDYGEGAVISTLAAILKVVEAESSQYHESTVKRAESMWQNRNKIRF